MRPAKPWFRSDRDAWYVQHNGKQVLLARGKAKKAEALAAFHKLMLLGGNALSDGASLPIATLCDLFLDFSQVNYTPAVYRNYKHFLQAFCTSYGKMDVTAIKPFHVNRWLDGKKEWNGAKRHAIISVKRVFSWGEQQGLSPVHPLRTLKAPRAKRHERVLTADERTLILESIKDKAFHNFLTAMIGTGCRPSEVAGVTASNVNFEIGVWVLPQHKTAKKTGKPPGESWAEKLDGVNFTARRALPCHCAEFGDEIGSGRRGKIGSRCKCCAQACQSADFRTTSINSTRKDESGLPVHRAR